jgi:hypothetical protein
MFMAAWEASFKEDTTLKAFCSSAGKMKDIRKRCESTQRHMGVRGNSETLDCLTIPIGLVRKDIIKLPSYLQDHDD